jgi:hypothetical protein
MSRFGELADGMNKATILYSHIIQLFTIEHERIARSFACVVYVIKGWMCA